MGRFRMIIACLLLCLALMAPACAPRAVASAPNPAPAEAAASDETPNPAPAEAAASDETPMVAGSATEILKKIGRHKRCGAAPGLAGWLVRQRTVWSLENILDGKQGKPANGVIISFFATWCEPCKKGLPMLQKAQAEAAAAGVPMILVAVPEFTKEVVPFLDGIGVKLPTIKDKFGGILKQWLLGRKEGADNLALPRTVLVNDTQQIVQIYGMEGADFGARIVEDAKKVSRLCRPGEK